MAIRHLNGYLLVLAPWRIERLVRSATASISTARGRKEWSPLGSQRCRFGCADSSADNRSRPESILRARVVRRFRGRRYQHIAIDNLYPIVEGHQIVTPEIEGQLRHVPHELDARWAAEFWHVAQELERDWLLGFNSPHAGASVDHLHYQCFPAMNCPAVAQQPTVSYGPWKLVDQDPRFRSAVCFRLPNADDSRRFCALIGQLHAEQVPFNLLAYGESAFVIIRDAETELVPEYAGAVVACAEYAGLIPAMSPEYFESVTSDLIDAAIVKSSLPRDSTLDLLARVERAERPLPSSRGLVLAGGTRDDVARVTGGLPKALAPKPLGGCIVDGPYECLRELCGDDHTFVVTQAADRDQWLAQRPAWPRIETPRPSSRLAALTWAAAIAANLDPQLLLVVTPGDHALTHPERMAMAIERAAACARNQDCVALLGVRPRVADSRLGYLLPANDTPLDSDLPRVVLAASLIEKPSAVRAQVLIERGAWANTGVLIAQVGALLGLLRTAGPEVARLLDILREGHAEMSEMIAAFDAIPNDSNLESFLAERVAPAGKLLLVESRHDFDDVGTVASYIKAVGRASGDENFSVGPVAFTGCVNVRAYNSQPTTLRLTSARNVVVISTPSEISIEPLPGA